MKKETHPQLSHGEVYTVLTPNFDRDGQQLDGGDGVRMCVLLGHLKARPHDVTGQPSGKEISGLISSRCSSANRSPRNCVRYGTGR